MMPLSERHWDPRLWQHPTLTDLWARRRRPRSQIRSACGDCGVRYDALNGTLREADNGHFGRVLDVREAARRLGIGASEVSQWLKQNNAILRRQYQPTD